MFIEISKTLIVLDFFFYLSRFTFKTHNIVSYMVIFCITLCVFKQHTIFTSIRLFQIHLYAVYTQLGYSYILYKAK